MIFWIFHWSFNFSRDLQRCICKATKCGTIWWTVSDWSQEIICHLEAPNLNIKKSKYWKKDIFNKITLRKFFSFNYREPPSLYFILKQILKSMRLLCCRKIFMHKVKNCAKSTHENSKQHLLLLSFRKNILNIYRELMEMKFWKANKRYKENFFIKSLWLKTFFN